MLPFNVVLPVPEITLLTVPPERFKLPALDTLLVIPFADIFAIPEAPRARVPLTFAESERFRVPLLILTVP